MCNSNVQVESALKCIINKEAVWSIDDFSPAHSSFCSVSQSNESQGDAETETAESTNESLTTSSSRSQTRQAYRLAYLPQTSRPLIPGKLFEGLLFGKREASADRRVRIHSTPRISYDEMLDFWVCKFLELLLLRAHSLTVSNKFPFLHLFPLRCHVIVTTSWLWWIMWQRL